MITPAIATRKVSRSAMKKLRNPVRKPAAGSASPPAK